MTPLEALQYLNNQARRNSNSRVQLNHVNEAMMILKIALEKKAASPPQDEVISHEMGQ